MLQAFFLHSVPTVIYSSQGVPWPTLDKVVSFTKEIIPEEGSFPLWCYYSTGLVINLLRWSCPTYNTFLSTCKWITWGTTFMHSIIRFNSLLFLKRILASEYVNEAINTSQSLQSTLSYLIWYFPQAVLHLTGCMVLASIKIGLRLRKRKLCLKLGLWKFYSAIHKPAVALQRTHRNNNKYM